MCLDLNRCLYYSDARGTHFDAPAPVRTVLTLLDGVVAGEGEGPLAPRDVPLGAVLAATDPIALDLAALRLMGFDERSDRQDPRADARLRSCASRRCAIPATCACSRRGDRTSTRASARSTRSARSACSTPHPGWRGHDRAGAAMKQIVQNPGSGKLELVEVPAPAVAPGLVLVRNHFSVVSPGTEKTAIDFARKSLLGKARSRPDLVRQVLRKLAQEGPLPTVRAVMNRLDVPQPLGYSSAGVVEQVGAGVAGFAPGRPRGVRGCGLCEPRRVGRGAREPGRARARRARARPGRVRHARRDRAPGPARRRADARRGGGGDRARPDRPARRAAPARERLPRARHRRRSRADQAGARPGRRVGRAARRRPRRLDRRGDGRPRRRLRARHRRVGELGAAPARRGAVPHEGPRGRGGRDRDGPRPAHVLREGARAAHEHVVRPRPLRPPLRGDRARLPDRVRALDREPQPPGVPRARGVGRDRPGPPRHADGRLRGRRGRVRRPRRGPAPRPRA